jgi:topoisomerase IA-like protein
MHLLHFIKEVFRKVPFGPFIKWNSLFINVSKKYDFDNLSQADIETLIEDKLQKTLIKSYTTGKRKDFG